MSNDIEVTLSTAIACDLTAIEAKYREQHLLTTKQLLEIVQETRELPEATLSGCLETPKLSSMSPVTSAMSANVAPSSISPWTLPLLAVPFG